jgi:hypothetical protein
VRARESGRRNYFGGYGEEALTNALESASEEPPSEQDDHDRARERCDGDRLDDHGGEHQHRPR